MLLLLRLNQIWTITSQIGTIISKEKRILKQEIDLWIAVINGNTDRIKKVEEDIINNVNKNVFIIIILYISNKIY